MRNKHSYLKLHLLFCAIHGGSIRPIKSLTLPDRKLIDAQEMGLARCSGELALLGFHIVRKCLRQLDPELWALHYSPIFLLIVRNHPRLAKWVFNDGEPVERTSISINSLALTAHRPFETMRRHVHRLAQAGLVIVDPDGVQLSPEFEKLPAFERLLADLHDACLLFMQDLSNAGLLTPDAPPATHHDPDAVAALGASFCLIPVEIYIEILPKWYQYLIVQGIISAGVRHLMDDPQMASKHISTADPIPGQMKRPIKARSLATGFGLPLSTVHRIMRQQIDKGHLIQTPDGLGICSDFYLSARNSKGRRDMAQRSLRLIGKYRALNLPTSGFDPLYLNGRPERAPLG